MGNSQDGSLQVRLFIFSGRPDPEWSLTGPAASDLRQRVRRTIGGEEIYPPASAGLGYRGFLVITGQPEAGLPRDLAVFRGVVTERPGPRSRHWRDVTGIEQLLLAEAEHRGFGDVLKAVGIQTPRPGPEPQVQ